MCTLDYATLCAVCYLRGRKKAGVGNSFPLKMYTTNLFLLAIDAEAGEYNHRGIYWFELYLF